ncbi:MAG: hypothetical protein ACI4IJ_06230 [Acutalibacteraceae bacterium]|nr:hypothetical protein [Bacillota bacterium]
MNKRKLTIIISIVAVSIIAAALIIPNAIYRMNENLVEQEIVVEDIDISSLSDDIYTGSYQSGHMSADVEVTIENGMYSSIVLTDYAGINPSRANKVINAIIEQQTITPNQGDIGTQFTDKIVQKAIYYAIRYQYNTAS